MLALAASPPDQRAYTQAEEIFAGRWRRIRTTKHSRARRAHTESCVAAAERVPEGLLAVLQGSRAPGTAGCPGAL